MAIMYTYVVRSAEDGNLGVFGSAKKAVNRGIEQLRLKTAEVLSREEPLGKAMLEAIEKLDAKELSTTLRNEGRLTFDLGEVDKFGATETLCERFHLE